MKTAATARLYLAFGLPRGVAFGLMRLKALRRRILAEAGRQAGRGNVLTACVLLLIYAVA